MAQAAEPFSFEYEDAAFQAFLKEATRELTSEQHGLYLRALGLKAVGMLVVETPVDTGRARSGWLGGAGNPGAGLPTGGSSARAKAKGRRKGQYLQQLKGANKFVAFWNGVRYIIYLELGSSLQAPAGMARLVMRKLRGEFVRATERSTIAALRLANLRSRAATGLRQGRLTRQTTTGDVARI